jgi:hypothetical protein
MTTSIRRRAIPTRPIYRKALLPWKIGSQMTRRGRKNSRQTHSCPGSHLDWSHIFLKRNLFCNGDRRALSASLHKHDEKNLEKDMRKWRIDFEKIKAVLEEIVGHLVSTVISNIREERESKYGKTRKSSKRLSKSCLNRILPVITTRKIHNGQTEVDTSWGTSVAVEECLVVEQKLPCWSSLILDTSIMKIYIWPASLERMCREWWIKAKSKDKRMDIVKRLLGADEAERVTEGRERFLPV